MFLFLDTFWKTQIHWTKFMFNREEKKSVCSDSSLMNRAWPVFFIWTQVQARLEDGLRTAANYVSTQYFVLMIGCFRHACFWRFLGLIISCRDITQWEEIVFQGAFLFSWDAYDAWILDVLWGQPIKLAWVASTSELLENQLNNLGFFKIIPSHFCRASEASKIDYLKN